MPKEAIAIATVLICFFILLFFAVRIEKSLCDVDYSLYYGCETVSNEMLQEDLELVDD